MIKRKVFIIKGFSKSSEESIIDEIFVNSYSDFFRLCAGGAYTSDEVVYLSEPNHTYLKENIYNQKLDYGIIVYIGHGADQGNNQLFQLNAEEIIKPGQFTLNAEKQIIILESCRVLAQFIPFVDLSDKIPVFEKGGILRNALKLQEAREIYDSHIKRCKEGIMICYACRIGEQAYSFMFSKMFLQHAINWHLDSSRHCAILPIDELMRLTLPSTVVAVEQKFGLLQWPEAVGKTNFPIAVSKF
ncbi:MAG: hypothetical protein B7Z16_02885 [Algoriphagus sp. 32-45-6]|nr:MAG: hypothetical protein B7Z16_02885 [Algoriphagus sp. 32-45-6]